MPETAVVDDWTLPTPDYAGCFPGDGLKISPCLGCEHVFQNKNLHEPCRTCRHRTGPNMKRVPLGEDAQSDRLKGYNGPRRDREAFWRPWAELAAPLAMDTNMTWAEIREAIGSPGSMDSLRLWTIKLFPEAGRGSTWWKTRGEKRRKK